MLYAFFRVAGRGFEPLTSRLVVRFGFEPNIHPLFCMFRTKVRFGGRIRIEPCELPLLYPASFQRTKFCLNCGLEPLCSVLTQTTRSNELGTGVTLKPELSLRFCFVTDLHNCRFNNSFYFLACFTAVFLCFLKGCFYYHV